MNENGHNIGHLALDALVKGHSRQKITQPRPWSFMVGFDNWFTKFHLSLSTPSSPSLGSL